MMFDECQFNQFSKKPRAVVYLAVQTDRTGTDVTVDRPSQKTCLRPPPHGSRVVCGMEEFEGREERRPSGTYWPVILKVVTCWVSVLECGWMDPQEPSQMVTTSW